jgi:hypothetical protein
MGLALDVQVSPRLRFVQTSDLDLAVHADAFDHVVLDLG